MITEAELHTLLADLESDRVERTISTSNTDKFAQAVCAFANDPRTGSQATCSSACRMTGSHQD